MPCHGTRLERNNPVQRPPPNIATAANLTKLHTQPHELGLGALVHPEEHEATDAYPGHLAKSGTGRIVCAQGPALQALQGLQHDITRNRRGAGEENIYGMW